MLSYIRFLEGYIYYCFTGGAVVKNLPANARDAGLIPELKRFPGVEMATPVFLPGKFHGQRSMAGYSPWGRK